MAASALRADSTLSPTLVVVSVTLGLYFNIVLDLKHCFVAVNSIVVLHFDKGPLGLGRGIVADKVFSTDVLGVFHMSYFIARRPRYIEICKIY